MKAKRWVERLERCMAPAKCARTPDGLDQFIAYENGGAAPTDTYGRFLLDCKRWFEWTINEHAARWGTDEWPGWLQLERDFASDRVMLRLIRQRIGLPASEPAPGPAPAASPTKSTPGWPRS